MCWPLTVSLLVHQTLLPEQVLLQSVQATRYPVLTLSLLVQAIKSRVITVVHLAIQAMSVAMSLMLMVITTRYQAIAVM